jgi:hypothetical protein
MINSMEIRPMPDDYCPEAKIFIEDGNLFLGLRNIEGELMKHVELAKNIKALRRAIWQAKEVYRINNNPS